MPTVYMPSLIQVKPQYSPYPDTGEVPENVLWFLSRTAGTPTLANLTTINNTFCPLWASFWKQQGSSARSFTGAIVTDWSSAFGLTSNNVGAFAAVVGSTSGQAPPQVASLISFANGEHYKGGHFRTYLPWLASGAISVTDPGQLTSTVQTNLTSTFALIEPGMNGTGVLGGQTQRLFRHRTNAALARLDPIVTYQVQAVLATQRRRLRKISHA